MHRALCFAVAMLAGHTVVASAQQPAPPQPGGIKLADVAGTWEGKSMVGPKDSVIVTTVLTATADGKWTMKMNNRDPIPVRVVASGGDSIVTEAGPYPSILRPGETVNVLRVTGHYKGDKMTGTFEARYASGQTIRGKTEGTRRK